MLLTATPIEVLFEVRYLVLANFSVTQKFRVLRALGISFKYRVVLEYASVLPVVFVQDPGRGPVLGPSLGLNRMSPARSAPESECAPTCVPVFLSLPDAIRGPDHDQHRTRGASRDSVPTIVRVGVAVHVEVHVRLVAWSPTRTSLSSEHLDPLGRPPELEVAQAS